jgi:carbon monoxide dehydrogenase subunit G
MQINLEKTFSLDAPAAAAWQVLGDIETVASCMPGAEITERVDESHYKGKVKAKVGPATMAFNGTIELLGMDPEKRELRLTSKGQDSKGSSSAQMDLTAWVVEGDSERSELKGEATVNVNGKIASLGGRLMNQVADQILNQFGKSFAAKAAAVASATAGSGAQAETEATAAAPKAEPEAINGLAFAWSVIVGFFKSLFGKKQADAG